MPGRHPRPRPRPGTPGHHRPADARPARCRTCPRHL